MAMSTTDAQLAELGVFLQGLPVEQVVNLAEKLTRVPEGTLAELSVEEAVGRVLALFERPEGDGSARLDVGKVTGRNFPKVDRGVVSAAAWRGYIIRMRGCLDGTGRSRSASPEGGFSAGVFPVREIPAVAPPAPSAATGVSSADLSDVVKMLMDRQNTSFDELKSMFAEEARRQRDTVDELRTSFAASARPAAAPAAAGGGGLKVTTFEEERLLDDSVGDDARSAASTASFSFESLSHTDVARATRKLMLQYERELEDLGTGHADVDYVKWERKELLQFVLPSIDASTVTGQMRLMMAQQDKKRAIDKWQQHLRMYYIDKAPGLAIKKELLVLFQTMTALWECDVPSANIARPSLRRIYVIQCMMEKTEAEADKMFTRFFEFNGLVPRSVMTGAKKEEAATVSLDAKLKGRGKQTKL